MPPKANERDALFRGGAGKWRLQMNGGLSRFGVLIVAIYNNKGQDPWRPDGIGLPRTPDPRTYHKSRHDLFMKGLVDGCLKQRACLLPIRTPAADTRQTQDSEEVPNATPTFMAARGRRAK